MLINNNVLNTKLIFFLSLQLAFICQVIFYHFLVIYCYFVDFWVINIRALWLLTKVERGTFLLFFKMNIYKWQPYWSYRTVECFNFLDLRWFRKKTTPLLWHLTMLMQQVGKDCFEITVVSVQRLSWTCWGMSLRIRRYSTS